MKDRSNFARKHATARQINVQTGFVNVKKIQKIATVETDVNVKTACPDRYEYDFVNTYIAQNTNYPEIYSTMLLTDSTNIFVLKGTDSLAILQSILNFPDHFHIICH